VGEGDGRPVRAASGVGDTLTIDQAARGTPRLAALVVCGVELVPAPVHLYVLFQRAHPEHPGSAQGSVQEPPPAWMRAAR
jgi:hypothetical protein